MKNRDNIYTETKYRGEKNITDINEDSQCQY